MQAPRLSQPVCSSPRQTGSLPAGSQAACTRAGQRAAAAMRRQRRAVPARASGEKDHEGRDREKPEERFVAPEHQNERAQTRAISDEPAGEDVLREDQDMRPSGMPAVPEQQGVASDPQRAAAAPASGATFGQGDGFSKKQFEQLKSLVDPVNRELILLRKQGAANSRALGAIGESQARASFHIKRQPEYWPGLQLTDAPQIMKIASCRGYPAEQKPLLDAVVEDDICYRAALEPFLHKLEYEVPSIGSIAPKFGQGSQRDAAFWKREQDLLAQVESELVLQAREAQLGDEDADEEDEEKKRWYEPYLPFLFGYCAAAKRQAPGGKSAVGEEPVRYFLLKRRRVGAPLVTAVAAVAAGVLRTSLDFNGEPRLAVRDGEATVEFMEAKTSQKGVQKAKKQLEVEGQVLLWLLHKANPKLVAANKLKLRGVIAVGQALTAAEREECEKVVPVSCRGLHATMQLDVWAY